MKPLNFARILRNGIQMGFKEYEIANMYLSKYILILRDIKDERKEVEEQRKTEEEAKEIEKLARYSKMS